MGMDSRLVPLKHDPTASTMGGGLFTVTQFMARDLLEELLGKRLLAAGAQQHQPRVVDLTWRRGDADWQRSGFR